MVLPRAMARLRADLTPNLSESMMPPFTAPTSPPSPDLEMAEQRMRRSLGLLGDRESRTAQPAPEPPKLVGGSPGRPSAARPRPRFVRDGEVPVTLVSRHRPLQADAPAGSSTNPQGLEAALEQERAARTGAERSLQEALATLRDLQTKLGHAELAQREAAETARAAQAAAETQRTEWRVRETRMNAELTAERTGRVVAEAALSKATMDREAAERSRLADIPARSRTDAATASPVKKTRKPGSTRKQREPQPVKWWLKTAAKR